MTYQALRNYVLIELDLQGEEQLASGVIIPQHSDGDLQALGLVVSVGPDVYPEIRVSCRVLFQPFRAVEAWREGNGMILVRDEDIYAVVEAEASA